MYEHVIWDGEHEVTRKVRKFYEHYRFPGVRPRDRDGFILMRQIHKTMSGRDGKESQVRILDAGCGTGNSIIYVAQNFSDADILGLDLSTPSLNMARESARNAGLKNIGFMEWDLMRPLNNKGKFDIILCLGVLHHTADAALVLANLSKLLKDTGRMYLWVYGRHGRYMHSLNQRLLGMLIGPETDPDEAVLLAKEFALHSANGLALKDLLSETTDGSSYKEIIKEPAWIADQFLHPNERLFDMEELLVLIRNSGLQTENWLGVPQNISKDLGSAGLDRRYNQLDPTEKLLAMDLYLKPDRYFLSLSRIDGVQEA